MIPPKTYPEDYSCIIPPKGETGGLFIGNLEAAQNTNTLQRHSIKAVLTAAKGIDLNHPRHLVPYMLYVPADDHQSFNISTYFDKAADFIASAIDKTNVMVHCLAGVSRSVSLVLSYFIKHKNYTYDEAFSLVKSKRRIIYPNDGFISQLRSFATKLGASQRRRSPELQHRYSASPQKTTSNNFMTPQTSEFKRSTLGGSLKKHYSINQTLNQQAQLQKTLDYKKYKGLSSYDDNKYQAISKDPNSYQSFGRIKRLNSLNIPGMQVTQAERRQAYGIFNNIQNKQSPTKASSNFTDIDKKIEQIRKKYSEMSGYQMSYSNNYKAMNENRGSGENNYLERWGRQDNKKDYKYLPEYDYAKTRQYHQIRPTSTHLYSRES